MAAAVRMDHGGTGQTSPAKVPPGSPGTHRVFSLFRICLRAACMGLIGSASPFSLISFDHFDISSYIAPTLHRLLASFRANRAGDDAASTTTHVSDRGSLRSAAYPWPPVCHRLFYLSSWTH